MKNINWKTTSRNTEIAFLHDKEIGKVFLKRSSLVNQNEIYLHEQSFEILNLISANMEDAISPKFISKYSHDNIVALEYIEGLSIHELWLTSSYVKENIKKDISILYKLLIQFHESSIHLNKGIPYSYEDFGPKNILVSMNNKKALIDPPLGFKEKDVIYDMGTLFFEIERSLVQTGNVELIFENRKIFRDLISSNKDFYAYRNFKKGLRKHIIDVLLRYLQFYKKRNPFKELLRGHIFILAIVVYVFVSELDFLFQKLRKYLYVK